MTESILNPIVDYYSKKIETYGATSKGVDWKDDESHRVRFEQLVKLLPQDGQHFSLLDYGCGYGELLNFLIMDKKFDFFYHGYDLSEAMIHEARNNHSYTKCNWYLSRNDLTSVDYVISSGIFNVKLAANLDDWRDYIISTLHDFDLLSCKGFAFNALTSYSDVEHMRDNLYYTDPLFIFDYCKRNFSRSVSLLHDYGLYEFTIIVRK